MWSTGYNVENVIVSCYCDRIHTDLTQKTDSLSLKLSVLTDSHERDMDMIL